MWIVKDAFGWFTPAPVTYVELVYCFRTTNPKCVLDLYSVELGASMPTFGNYAWPSDCECDPPSDVTYTGTMPASIEYASSGFGSLYALAGSPPTVLGCSAC